MICLASPQACLNAASRGLKPVVLVGDLFRYGCIAPERSHPAGIFFAKFGFGHWNILLLARGDMQPSHDSDPLQHPPATLCNLLFSSNVASPSAQADLLAGFEAVLDTSRPTSVGSSEHLIWHETLHFSEASCLLLADLCHCPFSCCHLYYICSLIRLVSSPLARSTSPLFVVL